MSTTNELKNFAYCKGYWLADSRDFIPNKYFDIKDPSTYPVKLNSKEYDKLRNMADEIVPTKITVQGVDTADPNNLSNFNELLEKFRNAAIRRYDLGKRIEVGNAFKYCGQKVSDANLAKRLFFQYVARQVISGAESVSSAAEKFNVNKKNVEIWVSIMLAYGDHIFLFNGESYSFAQELQIIREHFEQNRSVRHTCTRFLIFTYKRFKKMLRRYYKIYPDQKPSPKPPTKN